MFHVERDLAVEIRLGAANCSMWNILPPIGNQYVPRGTDSGPFAKQFSANCSTWNAAESAHTQLRRIGIGL